jgi:hypothetical protein
LGRLFSLPQFVQPETPVAEDQQSVAGSEQPKSVVVVNFPGGRELRWLAPDSGMATWQVGDAVSFRNSLWRVAERDDKADSLTLTLRSPTEPPDDGRAKVEVVANERVLSEEHPREAIQQS